jgi:hypothetical protein
VVNETRPSPLPKNRAGAVLQAMVTLARGWLTRKSHLAVGGGCQDRGQLVVTVE